MLPAAPPLIVTLGFPAEVFERFEALRQRHFPPERNRVPAHATLFHALPGEAEPLVRSRLAALTGGPPPSVRVAGLRFLGRGVAFGLEAPALASLRAALAADLAVRLTAQDASPWHPHVTVQNKVAPATARALHTGLAAAFAPFAFPAAAVLLWRYRGGPWEALGRFPFATPLAGEAGA